MLKILEKLRKSGRAAFSTKEYSFLLGKKGYARLQLHRAKNKGEIVKIKNGWWAFPDAMAEAVACEISNPCYLSFHSALYLHGLTTQIPNSVQLAVARKPRNYKVLGTKVREFRIKKGSFTGFYRKENLLLASMEKAFADALTLPRTCPEIVLVESSKSVDISKVPALLRSMAAKTRLKKVIKDAGKERA